MAISKGFFSKRRGKVGDLIFSVLNGQQVTKSAPASVANPKTDAQNVQRMKLGPAQHFYDAFSSLLNHSWQNVQYGTKSRNHFMSLALRRNGGPYVVKGNEALVPGGYPISSGSLGNIGIIYGGTENGSFNCYQTSLVASLDVINALPNAREVFDTPLDFNTFNTILLGSNEWIKEGMKLTMLMVIRDEDSAGVHFSPRYAQITLGGATANGDWDTFAKLFRILGGLPMGQNSMFLILPDLDSELFNVAAVGLIVSEGDRADDKRSTSYMAIDNTTAEQFYSESAYKLAIQSYKTGSGVALGDDWILNTSALGQIGRVVSQAFIYQNHTYLNLALVVTSAGANETFPFVDGGYLVNQNGNRLRLLNNAYVKAIDVYGDGVKTIEWNNSYMTLYNGLVTTASMQAPAVPIRPMPTPEPEEPVYIPEAILAVEPTATRIFTGNAVNNMLIVQLADGNYKYITPEANSNAAYIFTNGVVDVEGQFADEISQTSSVVTPLATNSGLSRLEIALLTAADFEGVTLFEMIDIEDALHTQHDVFPTTHITTFGSHLLTVNNVAKRYVVAECNDESDLSSYKRIVITSDNNGFVANTDGNVQTSNETFSQIAEAVRQVSDTFPVIELALAEDFVTSLIAIKQVPLNA